jgi:hypothetical protein
VLDDTGLAIPDDVDTATPVPNLVKRVGMLFGTAVQEGFPARGRERGWLLKRGRLLFFWRLIGRARVHPSRLRRAFGQPSCGRLQKSSACSAPAAMPMRRLYSEVIPLQPAFRLRRCSRRTGTCAHPPGRSRRSWGTPL